MEQVRPKRRKHHIIYKTTCIITGKWYVGLHSTDNLDDGYMGSGQRLWKSIKKYGKHNHRVDILEHCPDRTTLIKREAEIVTEDFLAQEKCMNLMIGGNANPEELKINSETTKQKISAKSKEMWAKRKADPGAMAEHIKKIVTPDIIAKRAITNTGKKRTPNQLFNLKSGQSHYYSTVNKIVLRERAKKAAETRKERGTASGGRPKGIPMTETQRAHLSAVNKGRQFVPRASCCRCRKETTLVALNRYHISCESPQVNP